MKQTNVTAAIASATTVGSSWAYDSMQWLADNQKAIAAIGILCGAMLSIACFVKTIYEIRQLKRKRETE